MSWDRRLARLSLRLHQAAIGAGDWQAALEDLAALTGGHMAELIGFGAHPFHLYHGLPDEVFPAFMAAGGHRPEVNSRVRMGLSVAPMTVLDEADFTTRDDMRRHGDYGALIEALDIPYLCLSPLRKSPRAALGLAVGRGRKAGNIEGGQRRLFEMAGPHVLAAVRTRQALDGRALAATASAFERMDQAAFILDGDGLVRLRTRQADALLDQGVLRLVQRRLRLTGGDEAGFQRVVHIALTARRVDHAACRPVVGRDPAGRPFQIDISPLSREAGYEFSPGALVLIKAPRPRGETAAAVAAVIYNLTGAEQRVAACILDGRAADQTAAALGVSIDTVRSHIRSILTKSDCGSQLAFAAAVNARL